MVLIKTIVHPLWSCPWSAVRDLFSDLFLGSGWDINYKKESSEEFIITCCLC